MPERNVPWVIKGVILDVDGTLVDSNKEHAKAWVEAFEDNGYRTDLAKIVKMIGMGGDKLMPMAIGVEKDSPEGKRISDRRKDIFMQKYLPHLQPTPGARELLERMRQGGLILVVASSAQEDELRPLLEVAGATDLLQQKTSSNEANESKPDPDIVNVALKKIGLPAAQAVMIGDTPYDIEAAARASVPTVAVRSGGWSDSTLRGAIAIYDNPADLLAHYDQSVFGLQTAKLVR
ncbi:MAG TPA: HAD family hydrolase [Chloroflexia bacterium]|nr:HAD family hydrolase [Chloroflexia bacterium]